MQNTQNADTQRVMNLVDLYRTKVGKESEAAKAATREYENCVEFGIDDSQWKWLNVFNVNDQLLGYFYAEVAGKNAEEDILQQLLPEEFDTSIYTQEEECFLTEHFKEMVNYIIHTPDTIYQNSYGSYNSDRKAAWLIPEEVLTVIKTRVNVPQNAIVYDPYPGLGQLSALFNNSIVLYRNDDSLYNYFISFFNNSLGESLQPCIKRLAWMKSWTWARIAMYANHQNVQFIGERGSFADYDMLISDVSHSHPHAIEPYKNEELLVKIHEAYNHLRDQGIMVLLCHKELLWKADSESIESVANKFRNQLVTDGALVEVIQLPSNIMAGDGENCIVIAQKGQKQCYTTFIDAQKLFKKKTSPSEPDIECCIYNSLDLSAWDAILQNKGVDVETGLRKMVQISCDKLNPEMLLPQFYVLERPTENEQPVTLSSICNLVTEKVGKLTINLPLDTPWVKGDDITLVYQGGVDVSVLEKANCPNNPPHTKDFAFRKDGTFIGFYDVVFGRGQKTEIGRRVVDYRHSYFIDGSKDVVLQKGMSIAVIRATGKPIAISGDINVFVPNETMDALSLAALLQMPVVNRQIEEYQKISPGLNLSKYMDKILVPMDKRIIHDETQRLLREEKVYKKMTEKLLAKKTEYINEVRMRKHDMGQYIFELVNIEDLMRYYIENRETEKDFCLHLEELLNNFKSSLGELSTLLDNLSKEEEFGEPERFSLDKFLSQLKTRYIAEGVKIEYEPDESYRNEIDNRLTVEMDLIIAKDMELQASLDDLIIERERENSSSLTSNKNMVTSIHRNKPVIEIPSVYVSQNDLQRAVNNILDNARKHGFTDPNRKDYEIRVSLAIDVEKNMFQIDFRNNGNPLPEGMNKMRYGIKGEKAGKTAGTGLGGNYVKSFVEHYGGDYDIFMEDGWTVVRIFLPIK